MVIPIASSIGLSAGISTGSESDAMILEDFRQPDEQGFPQGWEAQRSKVSAKETYRIRKENEVAFLEAKDANQRVYTKQISWNPKTHPVLTWRWRVRSVPEGAELIAAVYPSLDVDLMVIPVATKYVWSLKKKVGSVKEGGIFSSTEMVIRSGAEPIGEWVEEKINVYEDFKQIHQHEPAQEAWGISLLGGPGVEIDFGTLEVHPR
jgi:hypothetical protein